MILQFPVIVQLLQLLSVFSKPGVVLLCYFLAPDVSLSGVAPQGQTSSRAGAYYSGFGGRSCWNVCLKKIQLVLSL